jgi:hypothetical protein
MSVSWATRLFAFLGATSAKDELARENAIRRGMRPTVFVCPRHWPIKLRLFRNKEGMYECLVCNHCWFPEEAKSGKLQRW